MITLWSTIPTKTPSSYRSKKLLERTNSLLLRSKTQLCWTSCGIFKMKVVNTSLSLVLSSGFKHAFRKEAIYCPRDKSIFFYVKKKTKNYIHLHICPFGCNNALWTDEEKTYRTTKKIQNSTSDQSTIKQSHGDLICTSLSVPEFVH